MGIITSWLLNGVNKMSRKSILKQVYFNLENPKELELLVYYEDKFSSFGGIVKDLLYKQMMLEKGNISIVYNENKDEISKYVDKNDVEDYSC